MSITAKTARSFVCGKKGNTAEGIHLAYDFLIAYQRGMQLSSFM